MGQRATKPNPMSWSDYNRSALKGHHCPYCPSRELLVLRPMTEYAIGGQVVAVAYVNVCSACGGHVVTEREYQRLTAMRGAQ